MMWLKAWFCCCIGLNKVLFVIIKNKIMKRKSFLCRALLLFVAGFLPLLATMLAPLLGQMTIEDCYNKAMKNYPLIRQYDLVEQSKEYNLSNASRAWIPQLALNAKASYQSDVPSLPISIPGLEMPSIDKDQYNIGLELKQTIWDGGVTRVQKENIRRQAEVETTNTDVNMYSVYERINQIYFGILTVDAKIAQAKYINGELERNSSQVESHIRSGVATKPDLDAVKVEIIKNKQNVSQLDYTRLAYVKMLSVFIGEEIGKNIEFEKPSMDIPLNDSVFRPEMDLYNAQIKQMEAKFKETDVPVMPKIGLYVNGGYGKPGLNMLSSDFDLYYSAGINLSWNIAGFYTRGKSRKIIETSISSVQTQKETFIFNTKMEIDRQRIEIAKSREQLQYDEDIVSLRRSVRNASEIKLSNGTITVTDLMRDINAEDMAAQDKIIHEVELMLSIYKLKYTTNNQ